MTMPIILVCKEGPAREAYLREASSIGIEVDTVGTFGELLQKMITKSYQGIMVDLMTSIKSSREDKSIAQNVLDAFPLVQLKWDQQTNLIHTISSCMASNGSLAQFITDECRAFKPRIVRIDVRKNIHFNVLISADPAMDVSNTQRSITVNISRGGCFLYSTSAWTNVSGIWMVIHELDDKTPVQGEIRWRQPWGRVMDIPGIGIQVVQMTQNQRRQLVEQFSV
ncbi:MAG: PilZ domain-containing protein [Smithellaceae bacterium]